MANEFFVSSVTIFLIVCRGDGQSFTFYACDSVAGIKLPVFDLVCSMRYNNKFGQFDLLYFSENAEHCV